MTDREGDAGAGSPDAEDVAERFDFEAFGPEEMDRMTREEWEAAFDPDSWVTGEELLERVERDLKRRVAERDVFAVVERGEEDGTPVLYAYSDDGHAVVRPDGSVSGRGTVVRDVEASVALASMPDHDVAPPPTDASLPKPEDVTDSAGSLGHRVLATAGGVQLVAGVVLLLASVLYDPLLGAACTPVSGSPAYTCGGVAVWPLGGSAVIAGFAGVGFLVFGGVMLFLVANARLSDRFHAQAYRERLRALEERERARNTDGDDPRETRKP